MNRIILLVLALFSCVSWAVPIKLCVTHTQDLRPAAVAGLEARGFEIDPTPVFQVDIVRDPDVMLGSDALVETFRRIARAPDGADVVADWEYPDHYANTAMNTPMQLWVKLVVASEIKRNGHRAGIYGPVRIRANSRESISQTSIENLRIVSRFYDFIVIPVYISTHFEPCDPVYTRYVLNTMGALSEVRAVLPDHVEIMLAFQFSVRPTGNSRSPMTEFEAETMGRIIAASGATPMWWFEARESGNDAIDRRMQETDKLGGAFLQGMTWHRVDRNMDAGDPQGVE